MCAERNSRVFSLADSLDCILPFAPAELVPENTRNSLTRIASRLPPIARGLLECRFDGKSNVDLSVGVLDTEHERTLLRDCFTRLDDGSAAWQRVMAFMTRWEAGSEGRDSERFVWFEFDLDDDAKVFAAPSVFLSVGKLATDHGWDSELGCLSANLPVMTDHWLARAPSQGCVDFIGVMVPRDCNRLRLNMSSLQADTAWTWLRENGARLRNSDQPLFKMLYEIGDPVLTVDADPDQLGSRIGLECRPTSSSAARSIFDMCVAQGLCDPRALDRALSWCGQASILDADQNFPLHLLLEGLSRPGCEPAVLLREINHVKITFSTSGLEPAKIYLSFNKVFHRGADSEVQP